MSNALLVWGSTKLTKPEKNPEGYWFEACADGTDWGNAEAVVTAIRSHLQDGSLAEVTQYSNRTATVRLRVCAQTYEDLERGGDALVAEANVPGFSTLLWSPDRMYATPTVFDVVYATLGFEFDDLAETQTAVGQVLRRTFVVTFECLPHGHDVNPISVLATEPDAGDAVRTTVALADGSTVTGWSGTDTGSPRTVTSDGSRVGFVSGPSSGNGYLSLRLAVALDMSVTRMVFFDYIPNFGLSISASIEAAGKSPVFLELVASGPAPTTGVIRSYFKVPASFGTSAVAVTLGASYYNLPASSWPSLYVDGVSRTNTSPVGGTRKQIYRTLTVSGSARARAALTIASPTGQTLGDLTLLYTRSATTGFQPPLRTYRVASSSVGTDPNAVSGGFNALGSLMVFNIPACQVREAAHSLMLRLRATTVGAYNINWSAQIVSATNDNLPESAVVTSGVTVVTFASVLAWQTNEVGLLQLPTIPVDTDSTHMVRLSIQASSSAVQIDEGWLFDLDNGALSWVETTGMARLEVRTADTTNPEPSYWGTTISGTGPKDSMAGSAQMVRADWRVKSWGTHVFKPGVVDVFTVTSGTLESSCAATYYRAHLNHATPLDLPGDAA